jgi:hypothetical protein
MKAKRIGSAGLVALGIAVAGAGAAHADGPLNPLDFTPLAAAFPSTLGTYTISASGGTPTLTTPGGTVFNGVLSPDGTTAVFTFGTINIIPGDTINVSGNMPVALLSQQGMSVGGTINYSGQGPIPPSSGYTGNGPGAGGAGGHATDSFGNTLIGGGGAGGFGGAGGSGAPVRENGQILASGGPGGSPYGSTTSLLHVLQGGSTGSGLFGGGVIELGAIDSMTISRSVHADGSSASASPPQYAVGGGSGGGILIDASVVTLTGTLSAAGGSGGGGGTVSPNLVYGQGGGGGGGVITIAVPDASDFLNLGGTINVAGGGPLGTGGDIGIFSVATVPEPSGLVMAITGLLGAIGYLRLAGLRPSAPARRWRERGPRKAPPIGGMRRPGS